MNQLELFQTKQKAKKFLKIRIPYQGSKQKIMPDLLCKMLEVKPLATSFYDLFGGGASASFGAIEHGFDKVHYNELYQPMANFVEFIIRRVKDKTKSKFGIFPEEWYEFISRERFVEAIAKDDVFSQFCRIVYSFGNDQRSYIFGKNIERQKYLAHQFVMFQCKASLEEFNEMFKVSFSISNLKTWNERRLFYKDEWNKHMKKDPVVIQILENGLAKNRNSIYKDTITQWKKNIQSLENIQNLERIKSLERIDSLSFSNLSYENVNITTPPKTTIIYCDIPYKGTKGYKEGKGFNYEEFYKWFKTSPYTVFFSEYNAPFEPILQIQKAKLLNNKVKVKEYTTEKLFWNGK